MKNDNLKVENVHGENKITILGGDLFINNFEGNLELFSISGLIELNNINGDKISCRTSSSFVKGKNIKSNLQDNDIFLDFSVNYICTKVDQLKNEPSPIKKLNELVSSNSKPFISDCVCNGNDKIELFVEK